MIEQTKERPIILTADEVNAVMSGDKSQHRVIIVPDENIGAFAVMGGRNGDWPYHSNDAESHLLEDGCEHPMRCPFGKAGDRLWVQEDWRVGACNHDLYTFAIDYKASSDLTHTPWLKVDDCDDLANLEGFRKVWSETVGELSGKGIMTDKYGHYHWPAGQAPLDWHIARSMPRWSSRLLLEITDVRIEHHCDWESSPWVWVIEFEEVAD